MSFDASGKIEEFKFIVKRIKKYYESNNSYIKSNYPIVNEYGMPTIVKRFFEVMNIIPYFIIITIIINI